MFNEIKQTFNYTGKHKCNFTNMMNESQQPGKGSTLFALNTN